MHSHVDRFLRQSVRVVLPALIFFCTGAAAVQRQSQGYRVEMEINAAQEAIVALDARKHALEQEIAGLRSRARLAEEAARLRGLRPPRGPEIIILELTKPAEPAQINR